MKRWWLLPPLLVVATECTGDDYSLGHNGGGVSGAGFFGSGGKPSAGGASMGRGGSGGTFDAGGSVFAGAAGAFDSTGGASSAAGGPTIEGGTTFGSGGTSAGASGAGSSSGGQGTVLPCEVPVNRVCLNVLPLTTFSAAAGSGSGGVGNEVEPDPELDALFPHASAVAFENSVLNAVNAGGQIAGARVCDDGQMRAVVFEDGVPRDLTDALDAEYSEATRINGKGTVIGEFAYRASSMSTHGTLGFIWKAGVTTKLEELGPVSMVAINDQDQVLIARALEEPNCPLWNCGARGLLWRDGVATDLGTLGGASTIPVAMNNRGVVVGRSQRPGAERPNDGWYPFIWQDGVMTELPGPYSPGISSDDMWIDDSGRIAIDGRLWAGGSPITPVAPFQVSAQAFNDPDFFAGVAKIPWGGGEASSYRPVVFKNGLTIPLWGNVGGKRFFDGAVHDMNESGLIVGVGNTMVIGWERSGGAWHPQVNIVASQAVVWSGDCYLGCCSEVIADPGGEGGAAGVPTGGAGGN
jgi:hypothetical protein